MRQFSAAPPPPEGPRQPAQGLVEYGLILAFVSVVALAGLLWLGPAINEAFFIPATASI
jgi:hypothetical protein